MESKLNGPYLFVRLDPNESLLESIKTLSSEHVIKTGIILSGIGQLKQITLGYFKEKDNYTPQTFEEVYELLSLSGTIISHHNQYIPHLHACIGSIDKKTFGGHLLSATVEVTNEIVILIIDASIQRQKSQITGLMELSL